MKTIQCGGCGQEIETSADFTDLEKFPPDGNNRGLLIYCDKCQAKYQIGSPAILKKNPTSAA